MKVTSRPFVFAGSVALASLAATASAAPERLAPTCGPAVLAPAPPIALPPVVTGQVSFYAAEYDRQGRPQERAYALSAHTLRPLASIYKPVLVWAALRDVDARRLQLRQRFTTTAANRSIEAFSPGTNTLRFLLDRTIRNSENTASDIVHLAVGPQRVAALTANSSNCTSVLLTTKAFWSAQAGMLPALVISTDRDASLRSAERYFTLAPADRVAFAGQLVHASRQVNAGALLDRLDGYFKGPRYDARLDTYWQNTSTAKAYTDLMATMFVAGGLQPETRRVFRDVMAQGCCRPVRAPFTYSYWGAKAGSGWRLLTLTGYLERPDGRILAYTYLNHESDTLDAERMEQQIPAVMTWIAKVLALHQS
ncbi:serine hydrolase [Deinococcus peraridilitoris]|uniref:Beta-lactamase class A catalytic domain-containing protein n=1 Tax=Deinococcus peraridilitoris (strain DSM 19664 / LMG 22246 / CIP 109416 / KR-200) TaxID=937777 RepID=L0A0M9_DEIPD|nr:serine hydrolase [Deinococcus peraridilitoris]AFZ66722.1 hypothetical protein Deipe_1165 [Deinococcus peraridilitoris DSM 19664]